MDIETDYPGPGDVMDASFGASTPSSGAPLGSDAPVLSESEHGTGHHAPPWALVVLSSFIGAALALGAVALLGGFDHDPSEALAQPSPVVVAVPEAGSAEPNAVEIPMVTSPADVDAAAVGRIVIPSIVSVEVGSATPEGFQPVATGSGVIIDAAAGYIVTNDHVIDSDDEFQVVLSDKRIFDATLVGTDPITDLAVLRIDATGLRAIELGAADSLEVGAPTVAVGSPLGLEGGPSLTVGVLSASGRQVRTTPDATLFGMLQTDAPITQGSSGGALVDSQGRLIGITTAVGVSDIGVEGIGFASPIELVDRVVTEIIASGAVEHAFIGITGLTEYESIDENGSFPAGVLVNTVEEGTGAEAGGLNVDDIITAVDGQDIATMEELISMLRRRAVGDVSILEILRSGEQLTITVVFGPRPG